MTNSPRSHPLQRILIVRGISTQPRPWSSAVQTAGCTELAYLDEQPTDAFIASVLAGGEELTGMDMSSSKSPKQKPHRLDMVSTEATNEVHSDQSDGTCRRANSSITSVN